MLLIVGIGAKAASSYQDSGNYFYTCRKNGTERKYMIYADEQEPNSTLLYEKETDKPNGVIVSVPIKNGDKRDFIKSIKEQLAYFANVYFINCDINNDDISIIRNEKFQISSLQNDSKMHITLDDVYYPIDFSKLGIPVIDNVSVALRFSLTDGLTVIPNRENLEYTKETKQLILNRIKEVSTHFISLYNEQIIDLKDEEEIIKYFDNISHKCVTITDNIEFPIKDIKKYSEVPVNLSVSCKKYKNIDLRTLYESKSHILNCYGIYSIINNGKFVKSTYSDSAMIGYITDEKDGKNFLLGDPDRTPKKKNFLRHYYSKGYIKVIHKSRNWKIRFSKDRNRKETNLYILLELYKKPKNEWRDIVNDWLLFEQSVVSKIPVEKDIKIDPAWEKSMEAFKVVCTSLKLHGDFNLKIAKRSKKYNIPCVFESTFCKLTDKKVKNKDIFYSTEKEILIKLYKITENWDVKNFLFALVGVGDEKRLNAIEHYNIKKVDKLFMEYNKIFIKIATAHKVELFYNKYKDVFHYKKHLDSICPKYVEVLSRLEQYYTKHNLSSSYPNLVSSIVELCEKNNWKDFSIEADLKAAEKEIEKIKFFTLLTSSSRYSSHALKSESIALIQEVLKGRKFRMDWMNYPVQKHESLMVLFKEKNEDELFPESEHETELDFSEELELTQEINN